MNHRFAVQLTLKAQLIEILKERPLSLRQLALEIGIDITSFHLFWKCKSVTGIKNRMLIEKYINSFKPEGPVDVYEIIKQYK